MIATFGLWIMRIWRISQYKRLAVQFLKAIGAMDTPQIFEDRSNRHRDRRNAKNEVLRYEYSTRPFEDGEFKDIWHRPAYHYFDGHIVDCYLVGLSQVLTQN